VIATGSDATTVTDSFTGMYARVIRNAFSEDYRKSGAPVLPPGIQLMAAMDIYKQSENMETPDYYTLYSGQGIDHITEVRPAAEILKEVVEEASGILGP
jgi:NAD(P)H-dependent flavin oxidoreductase YrpB (nitropropane dioxygenase family)